jgi:2'-hydroxyisoflavone reductase
VPDAPELVTQVIDVRDLARWLVEVGSCGVCRIFNATGDTVPLTQHLQVARTVASHHGPVVAASPQ